MKHLLSYIFLTLLCLAANSQQKGSKPFHFSIDAGAGIYSTFSSPQPGVNGKGSAGISYLLSTSYFNKKHIFKIRYLYHDEFFNLSESPLEIFSDAGLLYGKTIYEGKKSKFNLYGGAGFVKGHVRGNYLPANMQQGFLGSDYENIRIFVPALLQEAEFVYYPSKHFGLGISLTGNINTKSSHWAGFFKLCVGKYR